MKKYRRPIAELQNAHGGQDVWVIASGGSMNYVAPRFFEGKITIGVDEAYLKFPCRYLVRKDHERAVDAWRTGIPLILSEHDCGFYGNPRNDVPGEAWYFQHLHNACASVDVSVIGTDTIVVSSSTITSALHIAAYMGARNILICGHDCGTLDGQVQLQGYYGQDIGQGYRNWLRLIEPHTIAVRERLKEVYGCEIYSLNPFVNFGLEGHRYEHC